MFQSGMLTRTWRTITRATRWLADHNLARIGIMYGSIALVLFVAHAVQDWARAREKDVEVERLEELLWQEVDGGRIASELRKLEIGELTGAIEPEQADDLRNRIESVRTELRQSVRRRAQELIRQKRQTEFEKEMSRLGVSWPDVVRR